MYKELFHFERLPFAATPDRRSLFAPQSVRKLIDELTFRLSAGQGVCVVTGPPGSGKMLLCKTVASALAGGFSILSVPTAGTLDPRTLLQTLLNELDEAYQSFDEHELRLAFIAAARKRAQRERPCVVLVDESERASERVLDELRTLAVLDDDSVPLTRLLIVGGLALEETLASPECEPLNQQIVCHRFLEAFPLTESVEYILHRVVSAGGDPAATFSIDALDLIVQSSGGNPRCLNRLCDESLILAAEQNARRVEREHVAQALDEQRRLPLRWNDSPASRPASATESSAESSSLEFDASLDDSSEDSQELESAWDSDRLTESEITETERDEFVLEETAIANELDTTADPHGQSAEVEPVNDRYAALDSQGGMRLRTFDDSAVPPGWRTSAPAANACADAPPEPPAGLSGSTPASAVDSNPGRIVRTDPAAEPGLSEGTTPSWRRSAWGSASEPDAIDYDVVEPEATAESPSSQPSEEPVIEREESVAVSAGMMKIVPAATDHLPLESEPSRVPVPRPSTSRLFRTLRRKLEHPTGR